MTLTEFLLARIAEDEADWRAVDVASPDALLHGQRLAPRMLADCGAKRRIVNIHRDASLDEDGRPVMFGESGAGYCRGCNADFMEEWAELHDECPTLQALALPYADHPDYREEWRP